MKLIVLFITYLALLGLYETTWASKLTEQDKVMCSTLAKIGAEIQQHRRSESDEPLEVKPEWHEVYEAMTAKVYQRPIGMPPAAIAISFESHCRGEMRQLREKELAL